MLETKNLTVTYNGFLALQNININIKSNTITAILGVNGAGKTSLLKTICGQNLNYSGNIVYKNENIDNLDAQKRVLKKIVLVPEGREVFSSLTVRENLIVGGYSIKKNLKQKINNLYLDFPILKNFENRLAGKLSGGQQQILAVARAMMIEPELLLVDEPTMGLTPKNSKIVIEYLQKLVKKNITVLVSSSTFKLNDLGFDKKIILENGICLQNNH